MQHDNMTIRDRIIDFRRVPASTLQPHPHNWRTHSANQRAALQTVLAEIGYADALLARETEDGSLQLIDGHLRAEITPEDDVPVLVVDLDEQEAAALLAVFDPLSSMAGVDQAQLAEVLAATDQENEALQSTLAEMSQRILRDEDAPIEPPPEIDLTPLYQVVIECEDEPQQRDVYEQMTKLGYQCRVLCL